MVASMRRLGKLFLPPLPISLSSIGAVRAATCLLLTFGQWPLACELFRGKWQARNQ